MRKRLPQKKAKPPRDVNEAAFDVMQRVIARSESGATPKRKKAKRAKRG